MMDQYALDEPGRRVEDVYAERARQLTKQPTALNWPAQEGSNMLVDFDEGVNRGKEWTDAITCMIFPAMRIGFGTQAISLALMLFTHYGQGDNSTWTFDFFNVNEKIRTSATFTFAMCLLLLAYAMGTLALLLFQGFITDSGKYSRGFRAGSKMFQSALLLDLLVVCFRLVSFMYSHQFLQQRWWNHLSQTRADFALFHFAHLIHGISLAMYGSGIFYMEAYHDEGTYEEFAWGILGAFGLAGLLEISMVFSYWGACFAYVQLFALTAALVWSMSFEPLLHYHASSLHDRTINDSVLCNDYAEMHDTDHTSPYEVQYSQPTAPAGYSFHAV